MIDGFLRAVPSDANLADGRLYDPTVADSAPALLPITVDFTGHGTETLSANIAAPITLADTGHGTAAFTAEVSVAVTASFVGHGAFSSTIELGEPETLSDVGHGLFTLTAGALRPASVDFAGAAQLTVAIVVASPPSVVAGRDEGDLAPAYNGGGASGYSLSRTRDRMFPVVFDFGRNEPEIVLSDPVLPVAHAITMDIEGPSPTFGIDATVIHAADVGFRSDARLRLHARRRMAPITDEELFAVLMAA